MEELRIQRQTKGKGLEEIKESIYIITEGNQIEELRRNIRRNRGEALRGTEEKHTEELRRSI